MYTQAPKVKPSGSKSRETAIHLCLAGFILSIVLFDTIIIYTYYKLGMTKFDIASGVLVGTISKVIIFLLYQKYLRDE